MSNTVEFVYVNQDGSVRELSPDEREYLLEKFEPGDGGRPYVKTFYKSKDGWGSISGFLPRKRVPSGITIEPANPDYVPPVFDAQRELIVDSRRVGDIVTENADGSVSCSRNPDISTKKRFALFRKIELERQRKRELLAVHPDYSKRQ